MTLSETLDVTLITGESFTCRMHTSRKLRMCIFAHGTSDRASPPSVRLTRRVLLLFASAVAVCPCRSAISSAETSTVKVVAGDAVVAIPVCPALR
jgi:hypothetical protein